MHEVLLEMLVVYQVELQLILLTEHLVVVGVQKNLVVMVLIHQKLVVLVVRVYYTILQTVLVQ